MSPPRLASRVEVSALLRRMSALGGSGAVLARGDADAGAILLLLCERGNPSLLLARALDMDGIYRWRPTGPRPIADRAEAEAYIERRRRSDDDLWVVELDTAGVEQFAAGMIGGD